MGTAFLNFIECLCFFLSFFLSFFLCLFVCLFVCLFLCFFLCFFIQTPTQNALSIDFFVVMLTMCVTPNLWTIAID